MTTKITKENIEPGTVQILVGGNVQMYGSSVESPGLLGIFYNAKTIGSNVTILSSHNAGSFGPIEIAEGYTVELEANSTWTIV
jgi:hypothetical protein